MRLGVAAAVVGDDFIDGDIEVDEGLIVGVGLPGGRRGFAVPGFVDVHLHGYAGADFARAEADDIAKATSLLPATGVTSIRPTLLSLTERETVAALRRIETVDGAGIGLLGVHLEGPFLSKKRAGAHSLDCLLEPDVDLVKRLMDAGEVTHMTLAPELPGAIELIEFLVEEGVVVSLGHSDASAEVAHSAFDAGASAVTHVFNASRPLRHRDPGLVGVALTRPGVFVEAVFDGVHLSDEASVLIIRAAGSRTVAVTDALAVSGPGDGVYTMGNREVTVAGGEARLADGTIASSTVTLDQVFRRLMSFGADLVEAAHATSTAASNLIGRPELGTLQPGTPADVVVLDDDHRVRSTYVAGRIVHDT